MSARWWPGAALRPGEVPRLGSPTIAGVSLPAGVPRGEDQPVYPTTTGSVGGIGPLAARLAAKFPETGVWPLIFDGPDGELDGEPVEGDRASAAIDRVDALGVIRAAWEDKTRMVSPENVAPLSGFPGLAEPSRTSTHNGGASRLLEAQRSSKSDPQRRLLLVPCRRPADAITVIGWQGQYLQATELSAVLRSWEERFAAVLIDMDSVGGVTLAVGEPPETVQQALDLAAEMIAVARVDAICFPGGLRRLA